jgi:glycosyltransferase involved in cell wall biosynthesis
MRLCLERGKITLPIKSFAENAIMSSSISIIIPAFNEEQTIGPTILAFHKASPKAEIIVVDNNCTDKTYINALETLKLHDVVGCVIKETRQGKGYALQRGIRAAGGNIIVMSDADCTYPAHQIDSLIAPIHAAEADLVIGNRQAHGTYKRQNSRHLHSLGNVLINKLLNILFGSKLQDVLSGYRAMSYDFAKNWPVLSRGFEVEAEMTAHALDKNFRITEVPIEYQPRPTGSFSKLRTFQDGVRIVYMLIKFFKQHRPLMCFTSIATLFAIMGLGLGSIVVAEFLATQYITHVPLAILATGLMIFALIFTTIGLILDVVTQGQRAAYFHRELLNRELKNKNF